MLSTESDKIIIKETIEANAGRLRDRAIFIFGCVVQARDIRDELRLNGLELFGFIDNNPGKAGGGKKCLGVPVIFPQYLASQKKPLIIICSKYFREMSSQLEQLGYSKDDYLRIPIDDDARTYDDSREAIDESFSKVIAGCRTYEKLLKEQESLERIFLCPYPGTGDIYMACTFLPEYLMINDIYKYIILVVGNSCKKVADLFEKGNVVVISKETCEGLLKFWEFAGEDTIIKPLLYWGWRTKQYLYADNHPQISFTEMFMYDVFEFDGHGRMTLPTQEDKEEVRKAFIEAGLKEGRTVIIAPYAGSFVSEIPLSAWELISDKLHEKGYVVCTNCSDDEVPISGTEQVFFNYSQAIPFLELAGFFIGIRSGLCDVISSAKCRKIILYEDGFNATRMSYFGLQKMGLCKEDIVELDYSGCDRKWLEEKIMSSIEKT